MSWWLGVQAAVAPAVQAAGCTDAQLGSGDISACAVGWMCTHQGLVITALGFLLAHGGLSVASAIMKKLGVDQGSLVKIIRVLAVDVKPTDASILKSAGVVADKQGVPVATAVALAQTGTGPG